VRWVNELWGAMRETSFVAAQVVTLGVVAMVLGLLALNAITHQPSTPVAEAGPSRPLKSLVPTLVPDTPTPGGPRLASPTAHDGAAAAIATPPPTVTPAPTLPPVASPTPAAPPTQPPPPDPNAGQPPPTATPAPQPTPAAQPTSSVPGQMMKVLPAADGLPARVRAEPTQKSPILVRVPIGASVEVVGTVNGDELQPGNSKWLKVKWKDVTGYVYSTLVGEG